MATLHTGSDDDTIKVVHNPQLDTIIIRVGYAGSLMLRDRDEAHALVDQLQDAIREQTRHQGAVAAAGGN